MQAAELKVYQPVWRCIYCGAAPRRKGALGKEHIIAKGLDGALILPRASCDSCGEKTKKIEGACLRQMFREVRAHLKIPTKPRRPEQRPSELRAGFTDDTGKRNWLDIPIEAHPFAFSMPILPIAGILEGKPPDKRIQIGRLWTNLGPRFLQKLHDIGADSAFTLIPFGAFCQMLAKIGHAYAVAEIGFERFTPLLIDLILDRDEYIGYHVGGEATDSFSKSAELHTLTLTSARTPSGEELIVVLVRLFARLNAPTYHVVVGRPLL